MGDKDEASQLWEDHYQAHRNFLIAYSFRMTGSLSDAEDIVQDAISECLRYDPNAIQNPRAWMTRICSNKALDLLKSSAKKRNEYIGTWLPDAIPESFHLETQVASF
jgi:RNA polymerase sigma-70 factor (ECF subfamily)